MSQKEILAQALNLTILGVTIKMKYSIAIERLLAVGENEKALELAIKYHDNQTWMADDGNCEVEYDRDDREEAAQEYVADGSWGDIENRSIFISVYTWPRYYVGDIYVDDIDDRKFSMIEIEPCEPQCINGDTDHDWQSPHTIVGGIKENPGVRGHGGGVIINEVCLKCGCGRTTDTWAQCPSTGIQGLHSVSYSENEYDVPAELMFTSIAGDDIVEIETQILSIGDDFLPDCAKKVLAGDEPTNEYYDFLVSQCVV